MLCGRCSAEAAEGDSYCAKCGFPLNARLAEIVPRDTAIRREIGIVVGGISLVIAAVAIGWFVFVSARSPQAAVRRFLAAESNGQMVEAGSLIRQSADSQLILSLLQTYRQQSGASIFKGSQITGAQTSGDVADVQVLIPNPPSAPQIPGQPVVPPTPMLVPFHLVRENGEWKIDATATAVSFTGTLMSGLVKQFGNGFQLPKQWSMPGNQTTPFPPSLQTPPVAPAPQTSPDSITL